MSVDVRILDGEGSGVVASVRKNADRDRGLTAYTTPYVELDSKNIPFINPTFGAEMNQSVAFTGTPEKIHDGTDSALWTATAISGTWTFDSTTNPQVGSKCVDATATAGNDSALFSDGTTTTMSGFTAITGQIRLEAFDTSRGNHVEMEFRNGGTLVGNSVFIEDYVDPLVFDSYQGFVIPKADLGLSSQVVDEMVITTRRDSGAAPDYRLDAMQIEQTGTPAVFTAAPNPRTIFRVSSISMVLVDALAGTVTDGTMAALSYDQLLAVGTLANGIIVQFTKNGKVEFSVNIKQLSDFLLFGMDVQAFSDGTDTMIKLTNLLPTPIVMDAREGDNLSLTITDNLAGLLLFRGVVRGGEEVL